MFDLKPTAQTRFLAMEVRDRFIREIDSALPSLVNLAGRALTSVDFRDSKFSQSPHDVISAYKAASVTWAEGMHEAWVGTAQNSDTRVAGSMGAFPTALALVDDEEVENRILISRVALGINELAAQEISDLKVRMRHLEGQQDFHAKDVFRPEVLARVVVEQWIKASLSRPHWMLIHEQMRFALAHVFNEACHNANAFLIQRGVLPQIDLRPLMRRAADVGVVSAVQSPGQTAGEAIQSQSVPSQMPVGGMVQASGTGYVQFGGQSGGVIQGGAGQPLGNAGTSGHGTVAGGVLHGRGGIAGNTIMPAQGGAGATVIIESPMLRMRQRAQGVLGQLRKLLADRIVDFDSEHAMVPSNSIKVALRERDDSFPATVLLNRETGESVDVALVARHVERRSEGLKKKTNQEAEKAIVEIVALMFQAILAEDRIPAVVRVWFARLQIPVLRVAIVDPDFFKSTDHPARQLIDRMGSCVMGFDAAVLEGGRLEAEIRRIVQVIEQYPETGKRVFQLVYEEFKKFLSRHLTGSSVAQKIVSVAQQVEQKEALSVQYTIELRKLLNTMPVSEEIREFMFRVWADVMAVGAVRNGNQHADTLALKRTATDLVWAASPKPSSRERTAVIQALPKLLQRLRKGMDLLGLPAEQQELHIKSLNDAIGQAFLNRADAITSDQIDHLARSLAALEDVVTDDAAGDFMLDPTSIEVMLGIDASALEVISQGGDEPSEGMFMWAKELEIGHWFQLHYFDQKVQVQYAWRSDRGQLHLFSTAAGQGYLIQSRRLAAYLQAGLLFPTEEEALTVRATRMAIAKLEAEPTRLLN